MESNYKFYVIKNKKLDYDNLEFLLGRGVSYKLFFVKKDFRFSILVTNKDIKIPVESNNYRPLLFEEIVRTGVTLPLPAVPKTIRYTDLIGISKKGDLNPYFYVRTFGTTLINFVTTMVYLEKYETKRGD